MGEEVPPRCCCFQFDTLTIKKMKNFNLCFVHCPTHIPMFTWGVFKSISSASNGLFRPRVGLQPQKTFMDELSSLSSSRFILISFQKLFSIPVRLKNQLWVLLFLQIHFYEGLLLIFTCVAICHLLSFSFLLSLFERHCQHPVGVLMQCGACICRGVGNLQQLSWNQRHCDAALRI